MVFCYIKISKLKMVCLKRQKEDKLSSPKKYQQWFNASKFALQLYRCGPFKTVTKQLKRIVDPHFFEIVWVDVRVGDSWHCV